MFNSNLSDTRKTKGSVPEPQKEFLQLLMSVHEGSLATVDSDGRPFASAIGYITKQNQGSHQPSIFILMSDLARHAKHVSVHSKISLLVVERSQQIPVHEKRRASLSGELKRVEDRNLFEELQKEYLKVFPKAKIFFSLPDFRFYELIVSEIYWIGGFGKAQTIEVRG